MSQECPENILYFISGCGKFSLQICSLNSILYQTFCLCYRSFNCRTWPKFFLLVGTKLKYKLGIVWFGIIFQAKWPTGTFSNWHFSMSCPSKLCGGFPPEILAIFYLAPSMFCLLAPIKLKENKFTYCQNERSIKAIPREVGVDSSRCLLGRYDSPKVQSFDQHFLHVMLPGVQVQFFL